MVKKQITKKLLKYRKVLEENGISVERMILFGSYARGNARPESDIDVCIVSSSFGSNRIQEGKRLQLLALQVDALIEPILFPLKQHRHDKISPLLHEIKKEGVKIN